MDQLSNIKKLGVIVLATKYLENLNLPTSRMISAAARALGVSRKTGYEAAQRIEKALLDHPGQKPGEEGALQREVFLLRIQNQVLRYERDNRNVRFAANGPHLPRDAKSLCVRILRDFKDKLSLGDIAAAIGVAPSSLSRWDSEADSDCRFPAKPEQRGRHRHAKPQDAQQVVEAFKNLTEDTTLEEFTKQYNAEHADTPLDRRTITRILQAAGLYTPEARRKRSDKDYHGEVAVYFPGAQAAVDGKKTTVRFTAAPEQSVTLVKEVAVDIASGAIVGDALVPHENGDGVRRVVVKAREECQSLLAVLADNRSSNTAPKTQWAMEEHSELGTIFTFPYHARTNGHVEGLFGRFSRIVDTIEIDDTSRETMARSIVETVWRIFIGFHNWSPRARLDGKSPLEYLRTYTVLPHEVEKARKGLADQQQRSRKSREPHPRLSDPAFRSLVTRVLAEHQFDRIKLEKALKSLVHYDRSVIESASCAFSAYSKRDGFDEKKRHFAYFMGIVKNKQKSLDENRRNAAADVLRAQRLLDEGAGEREAVEQEEQTEREDLRTQPEVVILTYAQMLMRGRFRLLKQKCLRRIREALRSLRSLERATTQGLEKLTLSIRTLPDFAEDVKEHMIRLLSEECEKLTGT